MRKINVILCTIILNLNLAYANEGVQYIEQAKGSGTSDLFTRSSCLTCGSYKRQAEKNAKYSALLYLKEACRQNGAVLITQPKYKVSCVRINGWYDQYACSALAEGTCEVTR